MVTGTTGARILALGDNCERSRNIADGHLVRVLLDLDLLVFDELGAARLQAQTAAALVDLAVLGLAHLDGHEGGGGDGLVGLGAAPVAGVRGHREHRLDLGGARDKNRGEVDRAIVFCSALTWVAKKHDPFFFFLEVLRLGCLNCVARMLSWSA